MRTIETSDAVERIGRTPGAKVLSPAIFVVALALIVAGSLLDGDAMKLYAVQLEIAGGVLAIVACIFERIIQRQIHLANVGVVTEATVVERWQYRTRNGEHEVNSRIAIVYDPNHPHHASRVEDLWGREADEGSRVR